MGNKSRIAKDIIYHFKDIIEAEGIENFYEPFCGSCALSVGIMSSVNNIKNFYCNDINKDLIALFNRLQTHTIEYKHITKEHYDDVRAHWYKGSNKYESWYYAYVGFVWSFRASWFSSYVNEFNDSEGRTVTASLSSHMSLVNDVQYIKRIKYTNNNFYDMDIKPNSIIYCDAPYFDTKQYRGANTKFDFKRYYEWLKELAKNNLVFISEYSMQHGFKEIDSWRVKSFVGNDATERLYVVDGGYLVDKYFGINEDLYNLL